MKTVSFSVDFSVCTLSVRRCQDSPNSLYMSLVHKTYGYTLSCYRFPLPPASFVHVFSFNISFKQSDLLFCGFLKSWRLFGVLSSFYLPLISSSWNSNDLQTAFYCPIPRKPRWASHSRSEWLKFPYPVFIYNFRMKVKTRNWKGSNKNHEFNNRKVNIGRSGNY